MAATEPRPASLPEPPYRAVVFTFLRTGDDSCQASHVARVERAYRRGRGPPRPGSYGPVREVDPPWSDLPVRDQSGAQERLGGAIMPPHCDSLDGPVVTAARAALKQGDVDPVLPYVPADGEPEVRKAFDLAFRVRGLGRDARGVADRWFFETVVRVHRAGEGAPYTGLKPAGMDVGPAIPAAAEALKSGSPEPLTDTLCEIVRNEGVKRHARAMALREHAAHSVPDAREYVEAMLGLQVWAHRLYARAVADPREDGHG